ncbi:branched-chain amino acid ABC transporter permease [Arthrobacter sp. SLBN-112]|uniref:branched-chain amino acid ABC transporter permease n=1 Tax=Arthrobacter sp. SLBN-112 TaxID=2768452 RepID=UPI0027B40859|nr:branched-chain amino acid ABC transporter permease [Arthrobacter sp. SLBN-112]MDQ0799482.1 branched-chain amino acid transport system permease protein [Arthrobacter sp. SLBN-112]
MQLSGLLQILLSSLATGALYALLLFGMLIVYRVSKAVNFAHGALGMMAAFITFTLAARTQPLWVGILAGLAAAAVISFATDRFILEPISRKAGRDGLDLVVTLGILLLLTAVAEALFGTTTRSFVPLGTDVPVEIGDLFLNLNQVVVTLGVLVLLAGFAWFLSKTQFGLAMRAVATDPALAKSMGLNVSRVRGATWAFAGLTAGVVGIVVASRLSLDAYYMTPFLIKSVIAGIIGGLDRFVAPLTAAFGLALFEGLATYAIGTNYGTPAVFIVVILLLAVLPKRFLSEKGVVRV